MLERLRTNLKRLRMSYIPKSDFLKIMIERGFVSECTDYEGLDSTILKGNIAAYIGFDATAKSLHVGSDGYRRQAVNQ